MKNMYKTFGVTDAEFDVLAVEFRDLCKFQSWQLLRKNSHNNHTDDFEDIEQELLGSVIKSASYYKRQIYIEECLKQANAYVEDYFVKNLVDELNNLWKQRTKHGAHRQ